jgi:hypothetical protein
MLAADQRLEVVGGASNGEEAVAKVAALFGLLLHGRGVALMAESNYDQMTRC